MLQTYLNCPKSRDVGIWQIVCGGVVECEGSKGEGKGLCLSEVALNMGLLSMWEETIRRQHLSIERDYCKQEMTEKRHPLGNPDGDRERTIVGNFKVTVSKVMLIGVLGAECTQSLVALVKRHARSNERCDCHFVILQNGLFWFIGV